MITRICRRRLSIQVQLASSSKDFSSAFYNLLRVSMEMSGETTEPDIHTEMVQSLKTVSTSSTALSTTAKSLSVDPTLPNGKKQLAAAARAVTNSINHLVNVCTSNAPGQTECDNAIRKIEAMRYLLEKPSESVNNCSYFESLDCVIEKSKVLGEALTRITNTTRYSEHIKSFSSAICSLVEHRPRPSIWTTILNILLMLHGNGCFIMQLEDF